MTKSIYKKNKTLENKIVVITYGTYDLFHQGHENILREAKKEGDILIVAVSTDEFNIEKGKKSFENFEKRFSRVSEEDYVDFVIPEKTWKQKEEDILSFSVNKVVMGSDWTGKFDDLKKLGVDVIIKDRTEGISSTILREKMKFN